MTLAKYYTQADFREMERRLEELETLVKGRVVGCGNVQTFYPLDESKPPIVVKTEVKDVG